MENTEELLLTVSKKQRRYRGEILHAPEHSSCMYVQIAPRDVGMFKFLLEAEDNLGYMSVVDRWKASLKVVFSPHQEKEMRAWLKAAAQTLRFREIWLTAKDKEYAKIKNKKLCQPKLELIVRHKQD